MSCDKMSFPAKRTALAWLRKRAYESKTGQIPLRAYKCPSCRKWHLTSKPKQKPRRKRA